MFRLPVCSSGGIALAFRTVFIESQCRCSYQSGYLVVRKTDATSKIHLSEISSIVLQNTQVYLSAYLLAELAKGKISLVVADEKCNPIGQYLPLYVAHNASKRVAEQLEWGEVIKKRVWQQVVKEKIRQQSRLLEERDRPEAAKMLCGCMTEVRSGDVTNREAHAARVYFASLFGKGFSRDDDVVVNASLNYGYAILLSMVNREIVSRGYLTQCGICHRNEYNQFNLSCDLMEPFRPVVDRLAYDYGQDACDVEVRRLLGNVGSQVVVYKRGSYRLNSVVSLFVQDCLSALEKKIAASEIEGFEQL
ncbi:MAG: type II CRISPR-associated endonuclease Cas1 [Gordonibacter sp.]